MKRYVIITLVAFIFGAIVGASALAGIALRCRGRAFSDGVILPCQWVFQVKDEDGNPVSGAELFLVDSHAAGYLEDRLWPEIGNWRGPGSLVTDDRGEVVFTLTERRRVGGQEWRLWGYTKAEGKSSPRMTLRYNGRTLVFLPLIGGIERGTIVIVTDKASSE